MRIPSVYSDEKCRLREPPCAGPTFRQANRSVALFQPRYPQVAFFSRAAVILMERSVTDAPLLKVLPPAPYTTSVPDIA
eukprot:966094-Rhodomonas_salina.1